MKLSNKDINIEKVSIKQLEYILSINEEELLNTNLLNSVIKSIKIQDTNRDGKIIRTTHIEYYGIGELKEYYNESSNLCKNQ